MDNIRYRTKQIMEYYSNQRQTWADYYPSERYVFEKLSKIRNGSLGNILDVGCACGGLGRALEQKFSFESYTGVDINEDSIRWAKENNMLNSKFNYINDDVLFMKCERQFDMVISLGCADWNIQTFDIVQKCWNATKPGGYLVISLRLTNDQGMNNISKSYQHINFSGDDTEPEIANYVVFNIRDALEIFDQLYPKASNIGAYGYWGRPSPTAVTPYERLAFTVFYIQKCEMGSPVKSMVELELPIDLLI